MAGIKAVNPGDILQAMENKLIADGVVPSADPIYWLMEDQEVEGNATGKHDILLRAVNRRIDDPAQTGGGRIGMRYELLVEVRLRTIVMLDRVGTDKVQLIDHWNQEDGIISAFEMFAPTDTGDNTGNALTVGAMLWDRGDLPRRVIELKGWGASIGVWRCVYLPKLGTYPVG